MCVVGQYLEYSLVWHGIAITVRHCPSWLSSTAGVKVQHIELHSENRVPLPVTETGYRSHFMCGEEPMAEYGNDPVSFVAAWLDHEAKAKKWSAERQLSLF